MSFLAFAIGLAIPACSGWLGLRLAEGSTPVLLRAERWAAGTALGITFSMWAMFVAHEYGSIALDRAGFLGIQLMILGVLAALWVWRRPAGPAVRVPSDRLRPRWELLVWALLAFAILKVVFAGVTFLLLTPTYLDDTLDNWNLRGKVFFEDRAMTLVMPGEDPETSPKGVSSYPPTVPLMKASLAAIAGKWSDAIANAIHGVWFGLVAVLLYCAVRKRLQRRWALLAVYGYLSMPLATMHGTNPYADVFVSLHVFLAAAWTLDALHEHDPARRAARYLLAGLAFAALSFTKNEGMIVYLPPLILLLVIGTGLAVRRREVSLGSAIVLLTRAAAPLLIIALPWLIFKWTNGLTFGNAKPFSTFEIYWRANVITAVGINTFFEGNWLFLFPLLFVLLAWRRAAAWGTYLPLTAFFMIVYLGQMMLFLFTNLSVEATMQTGYARGLVQLLPCVVLLTALLVADAGGEKGEEGRLA